MTAASPSPWDNDVKDRARLGMLTPSSNTVLEPITNAMLQGVAGVSAHFSRFRVTEISLDERGLGQFDNDVRLGAAELLADAKCDVIAWNGTSAGWLGFAHDESLCRAIGERTGARATSSILANNDLFRRHGVRRFGLVTPYTEDVQLRLVENYRRAGFECVAERHLGIRDNFSFSEVGEDRIEAMIRDVAGAHPQAISVICTTLRAAPLAGRLEPAIQVPIYDSIAVVVLRALELAGLDPSVVKGWGRIFDSRDGSAPADETLGTAAARER